MIVQTYLHAGFFTNFSLDIHHLNDSIYIWNCCNQAQFLSKNIVMKCLAIKIFAWKFLQPPVQKIKFNSTYSYNRKTWADIPSYIILPWINQKIII